MGNAIATNNTLHLLLCCLVFVSLCNLNATPYNANVSSYIVNVLTYIVNVSAYIVNASTYIVNASTYIVNVSAYIKIFAQIKLILIKISPSPRPHISFQILTSINTITHAFVLVTHIRILEIIMHLSATLC